MALNDRRLWLTHKHTRGGTLNLSVGEVHAAWADDGGQPCGHIGQIALQSGVRESI